MAVKPCLGTPDRPRCPNYAPKGKSRCPACLRDSREFLTGARGTSGQWRKDRVQALRRDGFKCVDCGSPKALEVHHVDGDARNNALENLVTLCDECHKKRHRNLPNTRPSGDSGRLPGLAPKPPQR